MQQPAILQAGCLDEAATPLVLRLRKQRAEIALELGQELVHLVDICDSYGRGGYGRWRSSGRSHLRRGRSARRGRRGRRGRRSGRGRGNWRGTGRRRNRMQCREEGVWKHRGIFTGAAIVWRLIWERDNEEAATLAMRAACHYHPG